MSSWNWTNMRSEWGRYLFFHNSCVNAVPQNMATFYAMWCLYIKIDSTETLFIIIRCKSFFLFIGREPTTWPANNCLQIMVCSCAMLFNCFWLQILFCSCAFETSLFSFLRSLLGENGRSRRFLKIFLKQTKKNEPKKNLMIITCIINKHGEKEWQNHWLKHRTYLVAGFN